MTKKIHNSAIIVVLIMATVIIACTSKAGKTEGENETITVLGDVGVFTEFKHDDSGVRAFVENEEVFVSVDKDYKEFYGITDDNNLVFKVGGLLGSCKGVFIGDQGNDLSPLLCILLDDGSAQTLDLYPAILNREFEASDKELFNNIVSFGLGLVSDGDGGYRVTFAVDKDGQRYFFPVG